MNQSELFIEALKNRELKKLQKVAKVDLHNHFYLGGNRDYILKRTGTNIPPLSEGITSMDGMHQWVGENIKDIFKTKENRLLALEACFQQAKEDGITILETGEDVWANGHYFDGNIQSLIDAFNKVHQGIAPDIDFRFQIGLSRHCSISSIEKWIAPFLEQNCFYSLDLSGDEMAQSIKNFKPIYRKAKDKGICLKAHVGEWGEADSVKEAVEELELNEVQHGISAANSPSVMNWLADHKIQLNICPTSNVMLNRVKNLKKHPIRTFFDYGIKLTINSDDVLVFGQGVSQEYLNLYEAGLFSPEELDIIRKIGLASRGFIE